MPLESWVQHFALFADCSRYNGNTDLVISSVNILKQVSWTQIAKNTRNTIHSGCNVEIVICGNKDTANWNKSYYLSRSVGDVTRFSWTTDLQVMDFNEGKDSTPEESAQAAHLFQKLFPYGKIKLYLLGVVIHNFI